MPIIRKRKEYIDLLKMKKSFILITSLLMQVAVLNTTYAQKAHEYSFDESFGVRSALTYLPDGLTGKGVLVGVIDQGIDFSHINFLDPSTLQTRVKYACTFGGEKYSEARTPEDIAKLVPYNTIEHGTHVAGIAAGSYAADGWHGIAPEASLLLADMDLKDDAITQSIKNIFAAADSLDMPLVLNMSIAPQGLPSPSKFYDGYHAQNLLCEELTANGTKPGRIIVVSSANNTGYTSSFATNSAKIIRTYSEATIGAEGKERFILQHTLDDEEGNSALTLSFKAQKQSSLDIRFFLYDTINKKEVTTGALDDFGAPVDFSSVAKNALEIEEDGYFTEYSIVSWLMFKYDKDIVPCCEIIGAEGTELRFIKDVISTDDDYFTPSHLIYDGYPNRLAMTPAVISVGNCDPHQEGWPLRQTSSFGVNKEGGKIPDVVAPGSGIISSGRYYNPDDNNHIYGQREVTMADGSTQAINWLAMSGTSQAAPLVTGLCALMLEYDPTLTAERIRELLHNTNDWTEACDNAPMCPDQAGNGILNTKALFEALMGVTAIEAINDAACESTLYDLYGNRLKQVPAQGFYIGNGGKKYIRL